MAKAQFEFLPSSYRLVAVSLPGATCLPTGREKTLVRPVIPRLIACIRV
jgi:hypothetical protein